MSAQDVSRGVINARRNALLDLLEGFQQRRNCSVYIARLGEQAQRIQSLRRPPLYKVFLALALDQIILCAWWIFLVAPPLMGPRSLALVHHLPGIGPFSLMALSTANLVYSLFACLMLQMFLYTARFEGSPWQATPGKALLKMKSCDSEGEPLSFQGSAACLFGQHMLVLIATLTIVIPTSWALRQTFADNLLRAMLPVVPFFAYFILTFVRVDDRSVIQMISRYTVVNEDPVSVRTILLGALRILFFGAPKGSEKSRLDWFLTAMSFLSCVWLLAIGLAELAL